MGHRMIRVLVGVLILGAASCAWAENWPQFRGPHRDGISRETGLYRSWPEAGPKLLWSVPLGPGYAGPAVYDGWVYVNDYDEKTNEWMVRCLSLKDGQERWRFRERKRIRPNHLITRTVPAVDGQYVFSLDPKCVLHCLDAASGKQLWEKNLPKEYHSRIPPWYAGQCPLVEETRMLIATGGDALVVALDKPTGKEIWRTPNPKKWQMSHASLMPAELGGVRQYVYCTLRGLQGIAADDGRLLWYHPAKFNLAVAPSPLPIGDDLVFMTSLYNADSLMIRVTRDGDQFQTKQLFRMPPSYWNSEIHTPILYENHLFAVGKKRRGLFTCLDLNGKIVWDSNRRASFGLGSYLLADGMFFVLEGRTGMLRLLEANTKEYRELAHAQVLSGHDVWAPMALSDGKLVLRDVTKMVCIEVGPSSEQASR
ncbi:MAG: PQQ-binding-like beta-propeller repeat protein [Planctomycetes bacterium]|nr:PQQ-binding-like beta-propeller repeat protein [Planctomycetota bacterium]